MQGADKSEGIGRSHSPSHITGFFTIRLSPDPLRSGSTGAGICLKDGVKTTVRLMPPEEPQSFVSCGAELPLPPTCRSVVERMLGARAPFSFRAEQSVSFPPNYGYGISGASALSLAMALEKALGSSPSKAAEIAHLAEIENLTGLGDVIAEHAGGFELRTKPGAPGFGEVRRLDHPRGVFVISSPVLSFPTSRMISEEGYVRPINSFGEEAIAAFTESPTLDNFMLQSRRFWERVGVPDGSVRAAVRVFEKGGVKNPSAKKGVVFGIVSESEVEGVVRSITGAPFRMEGRPPFNIKDNSHGLRIMISEISEEGAC
uniref:Pantoate kinase n=1 Tax=Candidatus Methanomethylicus mesodigestus TaxID=1867258 RepID=A0A7C3IXI6_9CREN